MAVGTPVAGRGEAGLDDLVGMFVNTVVLRTRVEPGMGFGAVLDLVREVDLGAFAHAEVPFERVVDELAPARSTAHTRCSRWCWRWRTRPGRCRGGRGWRWQPVDLDPGVAKFDLQVSVAERFDADGAPAGLAAGFTYASDVFDEATVRGFVDRFVRVLAAVCADPAVVVGDVGILDPAERRRLAPVRGPAGGAVGRALAEILTDAAGRDANAVALRCAGTGMSYGELDERSNRLARVLIGRGAGPEGFVAVALSRSVQSVVAVWAVTKTGAAVRAGGSGVSGRRGSRICSPIRVRRWG